MNCGVEAIQCWGFRVQRGRVIYLHDADRNIWGVIQTQGAGDCSHEMQHLFGDSHEDECRYWALNDLTTSGWVAREGKRPPQVA